VRKNTGKREREEKRDFHEGEKGHRPRGRLRDPAAPPVERAAAHTTF
jgi:hypothetical protein